LGREHRIPVGGLIFSEIALEWIQGEALKDMRILAFLSAVIFLAGCVAFQVAGDVQKGRMELLYGDPGVALAHFQRAAESNPEYRLNYSLVREGVWTYVGRAYYNQGKMAEARKALERARTQDSHDSLAALYLGLALAREGDRRRGLREIETGLRGLAEWLDYLRWYHPDGRFWDPTSQLRSEIQKDLDMISGKDVHWPGLISNGEWLGRMLEEEIERAHEDKMRDRERRDRRRRSVLNHSSR